MTNGDRFAQQPTMGKAQSWPILLSIPRATPLKVYCFCLKGLGDGSADCNPIQHMLSCAFAANQKLGTEKRVVCSALN